MIYTVTLNPAIDELLELESFNQAGVSEILTQTQAIGGKGINVARALKILGHEVQALALVGEDSRNFFAEAAKAEGIPLECFIHPGTTRLSQTIAFFQESVNTHIRRPQETELFQEGLDEIFNWLEKWLESGDYLVLSGSLMEKMPKETWVGLTELALKKEALTILDTSGEALESALAARPFMLKINLDEFIDLGEAAGEDKADFVQTVKEMHLLGITVIVITMGSGGAVLSDGENFYHAQLDLSKKQAQVWATGAGDAFLAGFLSGLLGSKPLVDCLKLGVACGGLSTDYRGCAEFEAACLAEILPQVQLHRETN